MLLFTSVFGFLTEWSFKTMGTLATERTTEKCDYNWKRDSFFSANMMASGTKERERERFSL